MKKSRCMKELLTGDYILWNSTFTLYLMNKCHWNVTFLVHEYTFSFSCVRQMWTAFWMRQNLKSLTQITNTWLNQRLTRLHCHKNHRASCKGHWEICRNQRPPTTSQNNINVSVFLMENIRKCRYMKWRPPLQKSAENVFMRRRNERRNFEWIISWDFYYELCC